MNRYDPRTPRTAFGFAAVALAAATLALSVLAPATVAPPVTADADLLTRVASERCVPAEDNLITAIDVVAVRATGPAAIAQSHDASADLVRGYRG